MMQTKLLFINFLVWMVSNSVVAQDFESQINIRKMNSLERTDKMIYKATEAIRFETGFSAKAGCHLQAFIVESTGRTVKDFEKKSVVSFGVFPNPTASELTIKGEFDGDLLYVLDINGDLVHKAVLSGLNPVVDISNLTSGMNYVFKVRNNSVRVLKL